MDQLVKKIESFQYGCCTWIGQGACPIICCSTVQWFEICGQFFFYFWSSIGYSENNEVDYNELALYVVVEKGNIRQQLHYGLHGNMEMVERKKRLTAYTFSLTSDSTAYVARSDKLIFPECPQNKASSQSLIQPVKRTSRTTFSVFRYNINKKNP